MKSTCVFHQRRLTCDNMSHSVYIEISVFSAYVTRRTDSSSVYRRDATRLWWAGELSKFEAFTSDVVLAELATGVWQGQDEAIALMQAVSRLPWTDEAMAVAQAYIREKLMSHELAGDAGHLALAAINDIEYLATWNVRHLANPNKLEHLQVINRRLGLFTPQIVTPDMLWLEDEE